VLDFVDYHGYPPKWNLDGQPVLRGAWLHDSCLNDRNLGLLAIFLSTAQISHKQQQLFGKNHQHLFKNENRPEKTG